MMNYAVNTSRPLNELDVLVHSFLQRCDAYYLNLRRREEGQETIFSLETGTYDIHTIYWHDSAPTSTFNQTNTKDIFECSTIAASNPRVVEPPFFATVRTMDEFVISNVNQWSKVWITLFLVH